MKYELTGVIQRYTRSFISFLQENSLLYKNKKDLFELLGYSIKKLYHQEAIEFNELISSYGDSCIAYLEKVTGTPNKLTLEDTIILIDSITAYFVILMEED